MVFNRSHYEDVLVVRAHKLVPHSVWSKRYDLINDFESTLSQNGTTILKFYLHISPEEQLSRFKQRLDDPSRHWKISESDYTERELWPQYVEAYEDAMAATSTKHAPWYVIPSNHKWLRNLAISQIISDTMDEMRLKLPAAHIDIADIRSKYHAAEAEEKPGGGPSGEEERQSDMIISRSQSLLDWPAALDGLLRRSCAGGVFLGSPCRDCEHDENQPEVGR